eukprot:COSAG05_NODE_1_length_66591_cov_307.301581_13_plen_77_part_00
MEGSLFLLHMHGIYLRYIYLTAPTASPADEGVDQIRNKKLQIHACAHKRVSVFTVISHSLPKGPFWEAVSVRLSID